MVYPYGLIEGSLCVSHRLRTCQQRHRGNIANRGVGHGAKDAFQQRKSVEAKTEARRASLNRWQRMWDTSTKGRWSQRLIANVEKWVNRLHGELNYYLTQVLTGRGCFRKYLRKINCEDAPNCPTCAGVEKDAEHTFIGCPRFSASRDIVEDQLNTRLTTENLAEQVLSSEAAWKAISNYAAAVMKELRRSGRERKKATLEQHAARKQ